jgi:biopolymer transport protein TolQ
MRGGLNLNIFDFILQMDFIVKLIIFILILSSIWSWSIIVDKLIKLKHLKIKTAEFCKIFWSGKMLEDIYKQVKDKADSPATSLFCSVMQEWEANDVVSISQGKELKDIDKKNSLKKRLEDLALICLNRRMEKIKYGLYFLHIIGSTAVLLGLFGTVWGIMSSFQSILITQSASFVVVAPGTISALISTLFGLFTAVPAIIFYNIGSYKFNAFEEEMENYAFDLMAILSRELDQ